MRYFFESTGFEFEIDALGKISEVSIKEWGRGAFKYSTTIEDKYTGTDCFVLGVPIDITLNFDGKRRTRRVSHTLQFDGITVHYGVRYGNARETFKTPVLVIGIESALGIARDTAYLALYTLKDYWKTILETGMDEYFNLV